LGLNQSTIKVEKETSKGIEKFQEHLDKMSKRVAKTSAQTLMRNARRNLGLIPNECVTARYKTCLSTEEDFVNLFVLISILYITV
jgi:hypothetical protein